MSNPLENVPSKERVAFVRNKLLTDNKWLLKGLVAIYNRQTADEQRADQTRLDNGIGFNGVDSGFLSPMAKLTLERSSRNVNDILSPRQLACVRKSMLKYSGQLVRIAEGKA